MIGFDSTRFDLIHASFILHHQIIINQPEKEKCILASTTFDAHEKLGHRCINDDPWKIYTDILGMLVYVDDNNITNNSRDGETVADVIKRTQHGAQLWNDLLRATYDEL